METIRRKNDGWTTYQARKIAKISIRRVNQVWEQYKESGRIPELKKAGRPCKPICNWEVKMVKKAYEEYNVSASTLELCIKRDYGRRIPHNRVHKIMLNLGLAHAKSKKDKRKKNWIRYERRHSLTAVHLDWYYDPVQERWVLPVIDDASRMMLSLVETNRATTDASIQAMQEALQHGQILQCITDHGTQFIKSLGDSRFAEFLDQQGIKHILCRIKHPQSNGKSEIINKLYKQHRHKFNTKQEFIHWYNHIRPHRSLRFEVLETPAQAFLRKRRKA